MGKRSGEPKPSGAVGTATPGPQPQQAKQQQQQQQGKKQRQQLQQQQHQNQQTGSGADAGLSHYVSNIQVLAGDVDHNSSSLLLFVDKWGRLLFNAGEGLQRLIRENKLRTMKLDHYMFTRVCTETMAGLPGLLLSTAGGSGGDAAGLLDGPQSATHLYGPTGLGTYVSAFSHYVNQEQQQMSLHEFHGATPATAKGGEEGPEPLIQTAHMVIRPVVIQPASPQPTPDTDDTPPAKRVRTHGVNGSAGGPPSSAASPSTVYVVELAGVPGKFDVAAANALGVPNGPQRGLLQRGTPVTLADGRVIEPDQVRSPTQPGPLLLVLDLPTPAHLEHVARNGLLDPWLRPAGLPANGQAQAGPNGHSAEGTETGAKPTPGPAQRLVLIAHMSPAGMVTSPAYQDWVAGLGTHVRHLLCSAGAVACTLKRATTLQAKLHCLDPGLFPMLQAPSEARALLAPMAAAVDGSGPAPEHVVPGTCLVRYHLMPVAKQGADVSEVAAEVDAEAVRDEYWATVAQEVLAGQQQQQPGAVPIAMDADDGGAAATAADSASGVPACLQGLGREECEITFLGTASSQPSKYRNVTALYVDCYARGGLLLDCGEDTFGQLKRRYGPRDAERRVRELRLVWVSHMHADHHGGLYRLLQLRAELLSARSGGRPAEPLLIVGPGYLFPVLQDYAQAVPIPFQFLPNEHFTWGLPGRGPPPVILQAFHEAVAGLGLAALQPFPVQHVAHACGIQLKGRAGWTVVFSGDTRPCAQVVEASRGAALLIHEATFEDDKQEDAVRKKHSTTGEALRVAEEAGVYRVVLTHFSTRYPTMPVLDVAAHPNMTVACDFMSINLADLPRLPSITAPLARFFQREAAGWEQDEQPAAAGVEDKPPGPVGGGGKGKQKVR